MLLMIILLDGKRKKKTNATPTMSTLLLLSMVALPDRGGGDCLGYSQIMIPNQDRMKPVGFLTGARHRYRDIYIEEHFLAPHHHGALARL